MLLKFQKKIKTLFEHNIIDNIVIFACLNTSFICSLLIPYFKDNMMSPIQISSLMLLKKLFRIISDVPFGMIFDRFGAKYVFLFGRLMKICSFLFLVFKPSFEVFAISMIFDGLSYSALYGKVGAYIYNNLSDKKQLKNYKYAMASYYIIIDVLIVLINLFAKFLLDFGSYKLVINASILYSVFSLYFLFKKDKNNIVEERNIKFKKNLSLYEILRTIRIVISTKKFLIPILVIYGIGNFFAFQFGVIATMILLDMKVASSSIALSGAYVKIIMIFGCLLALKINTIEIKKAPVYLLFLSTLLLISSIFYNLYLLFIWMTLIILFYIAIELSIEQFIDKHINKRIRGSINAIGWFISAIITIIAISIIGFVAEKASHKIAFILIGFILFIINAIALKCFYHLYSIKDK